MTSVPTEIVFSISQSTDDTSTSQAESFSYHDGPVKVPGPWKRGRPKIDRKKVAEPSFQFIGTSTKNKQIDPASRAKIRSHARKKKARPDALQLSPKDLFASTLKQIPGVDPFSTACIPLEPYMLKLLSLLTSKLWTYIYSLEEVGGWNPIQNYWLPLAFHDAALMHSFLACTDSYVNGYAAGEVGAFGLHHMRQVICIVNKRLTEAATPISKSTPISKATIAVIAGIALLEQGPERHHHWRTHMKGLKALVELFGGFEAFASDPLILQKIYRADLYGSMDAGEPPFFSGPFGDIDKIHGRDGLYASQEDAEPLLLPGPTGGHHPVDIPRKGPRSKRLSLICDIFDSDLTMSTCIRGLDEVADFWTANKPVPTRTNSGSTATNRDDQSIHEIARIRLLLTSIQYKLVLAAETQDRMDWCPFQKAIYELLRVTLIIFTLTILKTRPETTSIGQTISRTFLQAFIATVEMAKHVKLSQTHQQPDANDAQIEKRMETCPFSPLLSLVPTDFFLWSIFLAVAVLPKGNDFQEGKEVKITLLKVFSSILSTQTQQPDQIKLQMSQYLWISYVHNELFDNFWADLGELEPQHEGQDGVFKMNFIQYQPLLEEDGD